jgi:tetratricopeptide (TPR) repeat protein
MPPTNEHRSQGQAVAATAVTATSDFPASAAAKPQSSFFRNGLAAAGLAVVTFVLFTPALNCQFVNIDDPDYVTKNPHVKAGLNAAAIQWAFTAYHTYNWHPLTWLSLQLDATLWKNSDGSLDPRGFHLTNVQLHAANAALLFLALQSLTGAFWRSAAVALLFAVHPLRAESVAWVSERKDVLSTFFGLLALWAYAAYARRPTVGSYLAVAAAFAVSLLCKPMLVTLPCLFLVLDWWPLGRWRERSAWPLIREKLPLFALVVVSSIVTFQAQAGGGSVADLRRFPPYARLANAANSYATYLFKTFWPTQLAVYYPHPVFVPGKVGSLTFTEAGVATLVLLALSGAAFALRRRAPYLLAGWLWFLGTLVPTIGLIQVGAQAYADRYTYLPQVGILLALCWAAGDLARSRPAAIAALSSAVVAAVVLAMVTREQLAFWHDSLALWEHNDRVAAPSALALVSYGEALAEQQRTDEAIDAYTRSLQYDNLSFRAHNDLGNLLLQRHKLDEATGHFKLACAYGPKHAVAHLNLGLVLAEKGDLREAARENETAIRLEPERFEGYFQLGQVQARLNELVPAVKSFREAVRLRPDFAKAHAGLGDTLLRLGQVEEGTAELRKAVECDRQFGQGHLLLGMALESRGNREEASQHYEEAVKQRPDFAPAWNKLGGCRARQGRLPEAVECLSRAVELSPKMVPFRIDLASALEAVASGQAKSGQFSDAAESVRRARDEAAKAGRADLAKNFEEKRVRYARGEGDPAKP